MTTTALWTPDIAPPKRWLLPAVLYQDRISTFAPWPDLEDINGRASEELRRELGDDLYQPLRLAEALHGGEELTEIVRGELALWRAQLAQMHPGPLTWEWIDRGPDRQRRLVRNQTELEIQISAAQVALAAAKADVEECQRAVGEVQTRHEPEFAAERARLEAERAAEKARHAASKARRRDELKHLTQPLEEATSQLKQLSRTDPRWAAVAARRDELVAQLKAVAVDQRPTPRSKSSETARQPASAAKIALIEAMSALNTAEAEASSLGLELRRLEGLAGNVRRDIHEPWIGERSAPQWSWLRAEDPSSELPHELDTIAAGKLDSDLFHLLAGEGGFWVHTPPDRYPSREWIGLDGSDRGLWRDLRPDRSRRRLRTLIGPRPIVAKLLDLLGQWHALTTPGWVSMSSENGLAPGGLREDARLCVALQVVLPVPDVPLSKAVAFRLHHEEELARMRAALQEVVPADVSADDYMDHLRQTMAEPLAEIELALRSSPRLSARRVRTAIVHAAAQHGRETAIGLAAATVAIPVFGNTISAEGVGAVTLGTVALTGTRAIVGGVRGRRRALAAQERMEAHPFRYIYELNRLTAAGYA
jgi:hypothetical protein